MARKRKFRQYTLKPYQLDALSELRPPENLTVSEWAEKHRILDIKSSARPGPWRNSVTPYLNSIMDAFNEYGIEKIVYAKPSQVGGTECVFNMIGYCIDQDPAPTMIVYPSETLGKSISENRIQPMIKVCPSLKEKFDEYGSTDLELHFSDMYITLEGSNSPGNLASKPIRYLFLDEVDKYPGASAKEADPISLAQERTKTFHNRKIFITSTPTLKTGHIWRQLESCDEERHFFVPCPHCGEFIELKWAQVRFPSGDEVENIKDRAEMANYVCQECGCIITDADKMQMIQHGRWEAVATRAANVQSVGFWMNTLYSPFVSFSDIAFEFLKSKDDPELLQNFVNSWLAEPWEDTNLKTNADMVLERQTDVPEFTAPTWASFITGGVDVQESSIYWTIRAYGKFLTSQNIAHGQIHSWDELENIMNMEYPVEGSDEKMLVALTLIDSGYDADDVYEFCYLNSEWAVPVKGSSNSTMNSNFKISTVNKETSRAHGMQLVIVDTSKYKDLIASRMKRDNGNGSWMVYNGCDREYAEQVTAEHKIRVRAKGSGSRDGKLQWQLKTSHADNHYLDTEVYSACAADLKGWRRLYLLDEPEIKATKEPVKEATNNTWLSDTGSWLGGK